MQNKRKNRAVESVPASGESAPRPLAPPLRVWIGVASLAAAVAMVRAGWLEPIVGGIVDQAVRNIISLILCFSALMTLMLWFLRESGHAPAVKRAVIGGLLGGVGPRSTPTIDDGVVYAHGATGWLHAIDGATGRVIWKKNVLDELGIDPVAHAAMVAWGRAGSPLVTADLVIVPAGGPRTRRSAQDPEFLSLVAFDRATGARRWITGDEQISYVSPELVTFGGRELIVSVNEAHVAGYDPADGHEIWEHPWLGHSNSDASCSQAMPVGDLRLFLSKGYGIGAAVFEIEKSDAEPWTLREVWRNSGLLKTKFTNVAIHEGHAYGLSDGILECVRLDDGARRWKAGRYGQGQLLRVGPLLLVQAESGEVVLVDASPEKHVVRGRLAAIDGQTWNNLCLSGSRLLVRNAEEAACYELPVLSKAGMSNDPVAAPVTGTTP